MYISAKTKKFAWNLIQGIHFAYSSSDSGTSCGSSSCTPCTDSPARQHVLHHPLRTTGAVHRAGIETRRNARRPDRTDSRESIGGPASSSSSSSLTHDGDYSGVSARRGSVQRVARGSTRRENIENFTVVVVIVVQCGKSWRSARARKTRGFRSRRKDENRGRFSRRFAGSTSDRPDSRIVRKKRVRDFLEKVLWETIKSTWNVEIQRPIIGGWRADVRV